MVSENDHASASDCFEVEPYFHPNLNTSREIDEDELIMIVEFMAKVIKG